MSKQKMVIKVHMNDQKSRSKSLKIVVGISGVESAALQGQDKNELAVTGVGVDAVVLTTALRKNVGYAELVSVGPVEAKKEKEQTVLPPWSWTFYPPTPYRLYESRDSYDPCSIM